MSKIPTFLNFKNEKAAPDRDFILHSKNPAFLAEVFKFDDEERAKQFLLKENTTIARKQWNGFFYCFEIIKNYSDKPLSRQFTRMPDWYLYNVLQSQKIEK